MGAAIAQVMSLPEETAWWDLDTDLLPKDRLSGYVPPVTAAPIEELPADVALSEVPSAVLAEVLADGTVRSGGDIGMGKGVLPDADLLPVLPALRDLLPAGALQRGSVVATGDWGMLCLALAAGPVASGAWCAAAGLPHLGVRAAVEAGLDPARMLLVGDLGQNWPHVVASLLDGCDLVILSPPERASAQVRRKLEAAVRRYGAVLLVVGDWAGAQTRLRVISQEWIGIGAGHGRLRARRAQVLADGRGGWSLPRTRWLWLPDPVGSITAATDIPGEIVAAPGSDSLWLEMGTG